MTGEMCGDNRFKLIAKAKEELIANTNIESSPEEMAVLDNILFRMWQMNWLPTQQVDNYQRKAKSFLLDKFTRMGQTELVTYCALGLNEEAGEVAGKIKKSIRDSDGKIDNERLHAVALEIGDVLWYLAILADTLGFSLDEIADMNINKLCSRKERGVIKGEGDNR